jgi:hypothetical protein
LFTLQAVRLFEPASGGLKACWEASGGTALSLAACCGRHVAVAQSAAVHVLYCSAAGRLHEERSVALSQQASAVALLRLGGTAEVGARDLRSLASRSWLGLHG